jgi:hypothetical protein
MKRAILAIVLIVGAGFLPLLAQTIHYHPWHGD